MNPDEETPGEFKSYQLSRAEIRAQRSSNLALTLACYLGDTLTLEIPQFHHTIWAELHEFKRRFEIIKVGHIQKLFTVPREHSKTTTVKAFVPDAFRESSLDFLLYVNATAGGAINAIRDIVAWLCSESETNLWGETEVIKKNETEGLWILNIPLADGTKKLVILRAVGSGTKIRGMNIMNRRPNLVIMDDIEDVDSADSGANQKKLDEWLFGTLLKATAKKSLRIMIGNIIRDSTALARLAKDPTWNPTNFGAIVRNKITGILEALWPGLHSVKSLMTEYRQYRKLGLGHVWESEMMNLSRDLTLAESLPPTAMVPDVSPEEIECGFIVIDPAFGVKALNDETAMTVHVRSKNRSQVPIMADSDHGRWNETQMFDHLLELVYKWGLTTVAIEAVSAQRLIIPLFKAFMRERQMADDAFLFIPFQGQRTPDAKASRIKGFRSAIIEDSYYLAESQIDAKLTLEEWSPEADFDDMPDSCSMGLVVWEQVGKLIETQGKRYARIGDVLFGLDVGQVMHGRSELQTAIF